MVASPPPPPTPTPTPTSSTSASITGIPNAPPFQPRSIQDVNSFIILEQSLRRQHPELAKEGDKILNPYMLAKLVDGMRRFQDEHLGRKAKNKYWPLLRIPAPILHDRSRSGPLSTAILSAFRTKSTSPWRNFNFDNPKLVDDNLGLLKKVEVDLMNAGYVNVKNSSGSSGSSTNTNSGVGLVRPRVYFDESVKEGLGGAELTRLEKIVERFGGTVVRDGKEIDNNYHGIGIMGVTHIVGYDPEEHDAVEVREEEDRRKKLGEDVEKNYLRTLGVVDLEVEDDANADAEEGSAVDASNSGGGVDNGTATTGGGGSRTVTKKMALVHWWYHPSSYDEWLPAEDVAGDTETEPPPSGPPGGQQVVGCKFVRDVEIFNEWGVECDYAIMEYERKLKYFQQTESNKSASANKNSNKKRRKGTAAADSTDKNEVLQSINPKGDEDEVVSSLEPFSKKKKSLYYSNSNNDNNDNNTTLTTSDDNNMTKSDNDMVLDTDFASQGMTLDSTMSSVVNSGSNNSAIAKKNSSKNNSNPSSKNEASIHLLQQQQLRRITSDRRRGVGVVGGGGMNPRRIQTGIIGSRGESVRRTVYDGALRVSDDAYRIVRDALADFVLASGDQPPMMDPLPLLSARPELRKFLPSIALVRPSTNMSSGSSSMIVTEITVPGSEAVMATALNRTVPILVAPEPTMEGPLATESMSDPMRIRGGGPEDESEQVLPSEQNENRMDCSPVDGVTDVDVTLAPSDAVPADILNPPIAAHETNDEKQPPVVVNESLPMTDNPSGESAGNEEGGDSNLNQIEESKMHVDTAGEIESREGETQPEEPSAMEGIVRNSNESEKESNPTEEVLLPNEEALLPKELSNKEDTAKAEVVNVSIVDVEKPSNPDTETQGKEPEAKSESEQPNLYSSNTITIKDEQEAATSELETAAAQNPVSLNTAVDSSPIVTAKTVEVATVAPKVDPQSVKEEQRTVAHEGLPEVAPSQSNPAAGANTNAAASIPAVEVASNTVIVDTQQTQILVKNETKPSIATLCEVVPLPQSHKLVSSLYHPPAASAEDEESSSLAHLPQWYDKSNASDFERRSLPEWFNGSAPHRDVATYIETREKILDIAKRNNHQYITASALRRSITGDAGSLLRLHKFLTDMGFMNIGLLGEATPSDPALRGLRSSWKKSRPKEGKRPFSELGRSMFWSPARIQILEASVLRHVSKKQKCESSVTQAKESEYLVDWNAVASDIGGNVSASDCQHAFIEPPNEDTLTSVDASSSGCSTLKNILNGVRPEVLQATIDASLKATEDITEARKASFIGAIASAAVEKGRTEETEIEATLMDIVDQRMQRLENRVALLDDVEALLEAERVSLELERRDMYTTRCRHWFGDGSS